MGNDEKELTISLSSIDADFAALLLKLEQGREHLWNLSEELRGNRELVLTALRRNGDALRYASDELRGDEEVVLVAARSSPDGSVLRFASDELRGRRDFMMKAVSVSGSGHGFQGISFKSAEPAA